jgi:hypothetical protein
VRIDLGQCDQEAAQEDAQAQEAKAAEARAPQAQALAPLFQIPNPEIAFYFAQFA